MPTTHTHDEPDGINVLDADDVGFVPERMAKPDYYDGIAPSVAANVVREFGECPRCEHDIDPDVTDAVHVDRDVEWTDQGGRHTSPHTCENCDATLRILAEEKLFGTIGYPRLPDSMSDDVYFVRFDDGRQYNVVNTHQLFITDLEELRGEI